MKKTKNPKNLIKDLLSERGIMDGSSLYIALEAKGYTHEIYTTLEMMFQKGEVVRYRLCHPADTEVCRQIDKSHSDYAFALPKYRKK
jgi:hypothetical protein